MTIPADRFKGLLLGLATGDALGIPVKGKSAEDLKENALTSIYDNRNPDIPAGTWTAVSALAFCLSEAIAKEPGIEAIMQNYILWQQQNYWTAIGEKLYADKAVQDIIARFDAGTVGSNTKVTSHTSPGLLVRISPLVLFLSNKPVHKRFEIVKQVVSLTSTNANDLIICFYYLEFLLELLNGKDKFKVYSDLQERLALFLNSLLLPAAETTILSPFLHTKIYEKPAEELHSSHGLTTCLARGLWCFLNTNSYREATLRAVNTGNETNITAAVSGAFAGVTYGSKSIPSSWLQALAKKDEIEDLAMRIYFKMKEE